MGSADMANAKHRDKIEIVSMSVAPRAENAAADVIEEYRGWEVGGTHRVSTCASAAACASFVQVSYRT